MYRDFVQVVDLTPTALRTTGKVMIAVVMAALVAVSFACSAAVQPEKADAVDKLGFYELVNEARSHIEGAQALSKDPALERLASEYSSVCVRSGFLSHDHLSDRQFFEMAKASRVRWHTVGEILKSGPSSTLTSWKIFEDLMSRATESRILLNPDASAIGMGESYDSSHDRFYIT